MILLGRSALYLAFVFALYAVAASLIGRARGKPALLRSGENAAFAVAYLTTLAVVSLLVLLVSRQFQVEYVANYTSRHLPWYFRLTALWAGQAGSLLFWSWLLTIYSTVVLLRRDDSVRDLYPGVVAVLMAVFAFFIGLVTFMSNPFRLLPFTPADGAGLNPILQHPAMVIHPPSLYLGFVGMTVPFAFAMAALIAGQAGPAWLKVIRRYALFAWLFLSLGNLLGARWAYVELGWGGYWGWDPVENSAFMPWLAGTAFLHSIMIQEKKGMLKIWNMVLITLTFSLTILGTFITRSGVISSVHSFTQSGIGPFFAAFLGGIGVFSFGMILYRRPLLRSERTLESFASRESSFLFNNLILLVAAFAILTGTVFPIISEAVRGVKITVGPPFFNRIMIPIGLILLFLTGVGPLIAWRRASWKNIRRNFVVPVVAGLAVIPLMLAGGVRSFYAITSFTLSGFVLATIVQEFWKGVGARRSISGLSAPMAFFSLLARSRRRYGGYIVHLGVLLVMIGITGNAFKKENQAVLEPGQKFQLGNYEMTFLEMREQETSLKTRVEARVEVRQSGRALGVMLPAKEFHQTRAADQPSTEVALRSTPKEDLYLILASFDGETAVLKAYINPLVNCLWLGGLVVMLGTTLAAWPDKRDKRRALSYSFEVEEAVA
jgi:cytochrome c-type biogenesis protein CcmF